MLCSFVNNILHVSPLFTQFCVTICYTVDGSSVFPLLHCRLFCSYFLSGNVGLWYIYLLQKGCVRVVGPRNRLIRSLLSGSKSEGGNCDTAPYSRPYLLRSAKTATSAAIDYSKSDVEDSVVNMPSRSRTCQDSGQIPVSVKAGIAESRKLLLT
jgi:hypothetical protein